MIQHHANQECDVCHICNMLVDDNQHGILCELCRTWLHQKFVGLTVKQYNDLTTSSHEWFCNKCLSQSHSQFQSQPISSNYKVKWGNLDSLLQIDNELNTCYNTVITCRKKFFLVPQGNAGKSFIAEAARNLNLYNYNTSLKSIALIALIVFLPMML